MALQGCKPLVEAQDKLEILKEYGCFKTNEDGMNKKKDPMCDLGYCTTAGTGTCFQSRVRKEEADDDFKDNKQPHIRSAFRYEMLCNFIFVQTSKLRLEIYTHLYIINKNGKF